MQSISDYFVRLEGFTADSLFDFSFTLPHPQDHITVDNSFICALLLFLCCDQFFLLLEMQRESE